MPTRKATKPPLPDVQRVCIVLGLMCATTWLTYAQLGQPRLGIDDAYIFMVYGRNIADGQGAVYNPGQERVEGYSSPLWTLVVACAFAVSAEPEFALLVVNVLLVCAAVVLLWRFVDGPGRLTWRGALIVVWVFGSPSFVAWTNLTLMDTAIWCAVLAFGSVEAIGARSPRRLSVAIGLVLLTRPEGMLWALAIIAAGATVSAAQEGVKIASRRAAWPIISYVVMLAGLTLFRLLYFGYPLPNTYYAKVSPDMAYNLSQGVTYLAAFLTANRQAALTLLAMIAVLLIYVPRLARPSRQPTNGASLESAAKPVAACLLVLVGIVVPVLTGGDHFKLFRFYQPVWPLMVLPVLGLLDVLRQRVGPASRHVLVGLVAVACVVGPVASWINGGYARAMSLEFQLSDFGVRCGEGLNGVFAGDLPSVGVVTAGGFAFAYDGPTIDVMGLNNLEVAHAPGMRYGVKNHAAFSPNVFLRQRPELFLPACGSNLDWVRDKAGHLYRLANGVTGGFLEDERFVAAYQLTHISANDRHVIAYVDRQYVPRLAERGLTARVTQPLRTVR